MVAQEFFGEDCTWEQIPEKNDETQPLEDYIHVTKFCSRFFLNYNLGGINKTYFEDELKNE